MTPSRFISLVSIDEAVMPPRSALDAQYASSNAEHGWQTATVWMDRGGILRVDSTTPNGPDRQTGLRASVNLWPETKQIDPGYRNRPTGNTVSPAMHQLVAALLKAGWVDATWSIRGETISYYLGGTYSYRANPLAPSLADWHKVIRFDATTINLQLFHGTSSLELPAILQNGMRSLGSRGGTGQASVNTRLRADWNKEHTYLATKLEGAWGYAKHRALDMWRKTNRSGYEYGQYREWEQWEVQPVVLIVTVPDMSRLRADDDIIITAIKKRAEALWGKMSAEAREDQKAMMRQWFPKHAGFQIKENDMSAWYWVMTDAGMQTVMDSMPMERLAAAWKASIRRNDQVAYAGVIPPSHLKVMDLRDVTTKRSV